MAELTYRDGSRAVSPRKWRAIPTIFFGEDVAAGRRFKATVGLYEQFGPKRYVIPRFPSSHHEVAMGLP
jgi:pyruvate/2-oxoglutarate/acetoin dehydrogenase E1 component